MRGKSRWAWWVGLVGCGIAGCGQELKLPDHEPTTATDAPSEGSTGAGGADDNAVPRARLPIADEPVFTTFAGAGGDAQTAAGSASEEASGAANPGAMGGKASTGTGGGGQGAAGTKGAGGTTAAGGKGAGGAAGGMGGGGVVGAAGASAGAASLIFSEYVEGSGSLKALEIYALQASSLEGCELQTYFNGKLEPTRLALHGQLARGGLLVLCSTGLAAVQPTLCGRVTNLTFNGDDALALSCGGELLDVIGQIGVDPGDAWGVGATADHTLRRRCDVTAGRSDGSTPFEIDAEWLTLGVDTFTDLGVRNCAP